jgi:hypothetical protein
MPWGVLADLSETERAQLERISVLLANSAR